MSTDTDDESGVGLGSGQPVWLSQNVSTLLITANVGSIFEDPDTLIPTWQEQVIKHIATSRPQFIAIHFQEVSQVSFFRRSESMWGSEIKLHRGH